MLRRNVGGLDRAVRLLLGAILLSAGLFQLAGDQSYGLVLTILGLIGLATGVSGFCPPYVLFGFSTARSRTSKAPRGPEAPARTSGR